MKAIEITRLEIMILKLAINKETRYFFNPDQVTFTTEPTKDLATLTTSEREIALIYCRDVEPFKIASPAAIKSLREKLDHLGPIQI